jgi:hypothetical protein
VRHPRDLKVERDEGEPLPDGQRIRGGHGHFNRGRGVGSETREVSIDGEQIKCGRVVRALQTAQTSDARVDAGAAVQQEAGPQGSVLARHWRARLGWARDLKRERYRQRGSTSHG